MPKFTMEEHNRRMQEIREKVRQPQVTQRPNVLQGLLDRARQKRGL
ncbi:unnamed protein product [marine sediment metagenome]|uniref:Uncharacterized protein n=1 Tax=marine sediment metagenome TaxID=412755 RepID=X0UIT8_9ZZZZ